jgi:hypothetical protein
VKGEKKVEIRDQMRRKVGWALPTKNHKRKDRGQRSEIG